MCKRQSSDTGEVGVYLTASNTYAVRLMVGGKFKYGGTFATVAAAIVKRDNLKAHQATRRISKAKSHFADRKALPRPSLGVVVSEGQTKARKMREQFTMKKSKKMTCPAPQNVLPFSDFSKCVMKMQSGSCLYLQRRTPLAAKGSATRGHIAELVVRKMLVEDGKNVCDRLHVSHDFTIHGGLGKRAEVKLGRMKCGSQNTWRFAVREVKKNAFDVLYMVFEGLSGLHVFEWGGKGYSGTEYAQRGVKGGEITVCGDGGVFDADLAEKALLRNIANQGNCVVGVAMYTDPTYMEIFSHTTKTESDFACVPLGTLQAKTRGDILEVIVSTLLRRIGCVVALPDPGFQTDGVARTQSKAKYDRIVDNEPCEIKSCLLAWTGGKRPHYKLEFQHVHAVHHKHRYFAWTTKSSVHIWKQRCGNTAGLMGKSASQIVQFEGPKGRDLLSDSGEAERFLLKKMAFNGLEYVARLDFGPDDFANYEAAVLCGGTRRDHSAAPC